MRVKYYLPCCCNRDSLKFDMQHDHVLIKWSFDLLTISPGLGAGVGWSAGKIFSTMLLLL